MKNEIIRNMGKTSLEDLVEQLEKIKGNASNSLRNFIYRILPNGDIEVSFNSTSIGTSRNVAGGIAGNLSRVFNGGFSL